MENRELGLVEIKNRIVTNATALGIVEFRRSPTTSVDAHELPYVFMYEGRDEITEFSKRGGSGYPAKRKLEVIIEMAADKSFDLKQLYRSLRSVILVSVKVADNTFVFESRAEGPFIYGIPKVLGMRLILALTYFDNGL